MWALPITAEKMETKELKWMMDIPFWENDKGNIMVTPNEVLKNPEKFPDHSKIIDECDMSYPIHITKNNLDEWLVLDGLHRLAKLVKEGKEELTVKKVTIKQVWLTKKED